MFRQLIVMNVVLFAFASSANAQAALKEGSVEHLNIPVSFLGESQGELVQWAHREVRLGTNYLRIRFSDVKDESDIDYNIVFKDRNGRIVDRLAKSEFSGRADFWSKVVNGDYVRIELLAESKPAGLSFQLSDIAFQQNWGAPFSITTRLSDIEPITNYVNAPAIYVKSQAVAKLYFVNSDSSFSCTGFLVDDERLLTNDHCINTQELCDSALAIFGYELTESGSLSTGEQFRCLALINHSFELDAALLRLEKKPGSIWGKLPLNPRTIVKGEQAYLIQHPGGSPKEISRKSCSVIDLDVKGNGAGTDFGHKCNTLGGSSGSPILGSDFTVIGLHHFGFVPADPDWRTENRAVQAKRLVDWVDQNR
jgi:V8-like Glu-specific endopeptidase